MINSDFYKSYLKFISKYQLYDYLWYSTSPYVRSVYDKVSLPIGKHAVGLTRMYVVKYFSSRDIANLLSLASTFNSEHCLSPGD